MAQFFHTSGGFTYRPLGSAPQTQIAPKDRAVFDFVMGKKYLEIIGEEVPAAWPKPDAIPALREELRKTSKNKYAIERGYEFPRAWKVSYDEMADRSYGYGLSTDWDYLQLGHLLAHDRAVEPRDRHPRVPEDRGRRWRRRRPPARPAPVQRHAVRRPGCSWRGSRSSTLNWARARSAAGTRSTRATPGRARSSRASATGTSEFELFRAGLMPDLAITEASARVVYDEPNATRAAADAKDGTVTVTKGAPARRLPGARGEGRHREHGPARHAHRPRRRPARQPPGRGVAPRRPRRDHVPPGHAVAATRRHRRRDAGARLSPPRRAGAARRPAAASPPRGAGEDAAEGPHRSATGGARRTVTWLVAVTGSAPLRVVVSSQKGGTQVATVKVQ